MTSWQVFNVVKMVLITLVLIGYAIIKNDPFVLGFLLIPAVITAGTWMDD